MRQNWFIALLFIASLVAFLSIIMGAYLRLSDAGLSCPDFPGCYGHLFPPDKETVAGSGASYDVVNGWKAMAHRYVAVLFTILVVLLVVAAERMHSGVRYAVQLRLALLLTLLQGGLGYAILSLQLHPLAVTLHLLNAMLILALLWSVFLNAKAVGAIYSERLPEFNLRPWTVIAFVLVCLQLLLGGFTSSNYASLACPDLPACQQQWLHELDFSGIYRELSQAQGSYEDGVLDTSQNITVHLLHRYGAAITFVYLGVLSLLAVRKNAAVYRGAGLLLAIVLILQMQLGAANILLLLPLPVSLAHTGGAAVLLLCIVYLHHLARRSKVSIYTA